MTLIVLFLFGLYHTNVRSLFQRLVLLLGELIDCFSEALKTFREDRENSGIQASWLNHGRAAQIVLTHSPILNSRAN